MDITEDNMILTWTWTLGESEEKRRNKLKLHSGKLKEMEIYTETTLQVICCITHMIM